MSEFQGIFPDGFAQGLFFTVLGASLPYLLKMLRWIKVRLGARRKRERRQRFLRDV